ncbi:MAG: tRNA (N(6)-L-threonylcarbamoyladenosine(37)-C(2))-methylthiotransferase MtaB [Pseudomonadota bacterium]
MERKHITAITFGCKVNQYDSAEIVSLCVGSGYEYVDDSDAADIVIVHTCAVTAEAVRQARQKINALHRTYPHLKIIIAGCATELDSKGWMAIDGVVFVCGVSDTDRLKTYLKLPSTKDAAFKQKRARYFMKVQDGCDHACSYCVIRLARGKSRSRDEDSILKEYRRIKELGVNEVVLTGIHLGDYGRDLKGCFDLTRLVARLVKEENSPRIRLSSLHPNEITDDLISMMKENKKICRHIHLSVQSLSGPVLRAMNRDYDAALVINLIERLAKEVDGIFIAADIITGFPNESDEYFSQTYDALCSLPISSLHVFPFSSRPRTPAAKLQNINTKSAIKGRVADLRNLSAKKWQEFAKSQIGKGLEVIVTSEDDKTATCMSDNYLNIKLPSSVVKYGDIGKAMIGSIAEMEVLGKWV